MARAVPKAKAKTARRRRRTAARQTIQADPVAQRYLRCITRGIPAGTGVPDGDGRLAVVLNKKFATVIKPVGGRIRLLIGYSNAGCISQQVGKTSSAGRLRCEFATESDPALVHVGTNDTFSGLLVQSTGLDNYSSLGVDTRMTVSRLVNAYHELSFTGPALKNGGVVKITEVREDYNGHTRNFTRGGVGTDFQQVHRLGKGDLPPSAVIGPARETRHILMLPRDTSYGADVRSCFRNPEGDPDAFPFGITAQKASDEGWTSSPARFYVGIANHASVRLRLVEYDGLDDDASITISSNVCSQHLIQPNSTMHALARPSEAANQSWLQNFLSKINVEPLVTKSADALRGAVDKAADAALNAAFGIVNQAIQDL